jgi:hypothetical protein
MDRKKRPENFLAENSQAVVGFSAMAPNRFSAGSACPVNDFVTAFPSPGGIGVAVRSYA